MALFRNPFEPPLKAIRVNAEHSARIDDHIARNVGPDGPGLALAVVRSGTVVHAAGYGLADIRRKRPIDQETISHFASCGKQFTGLGILMLAEERKLDLDDPVARHLPGLSGFGREVTIRRLLYHTSGIRDLYDDDGIDQVLARCARPRNIDLIPIYADLGCPMAANDVKPGDVFCYSNSGYDLLGAVISACRDSLSAISSEPVCSFRWG
jgi:CubicO group peptidase (beta-lactamase class C family)